MPENCPVDFWTHYSYSCLKSKVCPLRSVLKNLKGEELCFPVENIRREHWPFLLSALSVDQSLTKVRFWSNFPIVEYKEMSEKKKKKNNLFFPIPYGCSAKNITDICKCASQLLQNSKALKVLMIENLFLRNEDVQNLSEGLKNSTIEKFSLAGCQLQDEYVEILCRGLQLSTVSWLDFSMCGLSVSGLSYICKLIRAHHLKRSNDMFPETLRYRLPILDDMKGLKRISLNSNELGDEGMKILMDSLQEDIWMKALDLQKCSIENEGARTILKILRSNVGLQLLDLRQNKIDTTLIDRIALQLSLNNAQKEIKFELEGLWKPPKYEQAVRRRIAKTKSVKNAVLSKPRSYTSLGKKQKVSLGLLKGIEKMHIDDTEKKLIQISDASSQTTFDFNDELAEMKKALIHETKVQNSLKHLVKKYKLENSLLRKELDKMSVLENHILIDQETFVEVTNIFEKFKRFLEAMKKYGLWECIEMLGVSEKSDIALKPFIIDTTRKCMQLVENDSPCHKKSDSAPSSNPAVKKHIPMERPQIDHHRHEKRTKDANEFQERAHNISRQIQEQIYAKTRPPTQNKVMKVFMDVRDNYSQSILSSRVSDGRKTDPARHLSSQVSDYRKTDYAHHPSSQVSDGRKTDYAHLSSQVSDGRKTDYAHHLSSQVSDYRKTDYAHHLSSQVSDGRKTDYAHLSSQVSDGRKIDHAHHMEDYYTQSKMLLEKHYQKLNKLNHDNIVNKEKRLRNKKSVGSQTPSVEATSHKPKSSSTSHEKHIRKISTPKTVQSSISAPDISSDESFPIYERSVHESIKSSEYKSLPTPKSVSKHESSQRSEFSKSLKRSQASGDHLLKQSSHSHKELSSDSESTLRSSKISSGKLPSDKSSTPGEPHSHRSARAKSTKHVASRKTSTKSSSTVSSVSSYKSRKEVESDSSGGKGDSSKSYLESVSDGSTDKDVESLSHSEVYSSLKDNRDSDHSNRSNQSSKLRESPLEKDPLKDKGDSKNSEEEVPLEKPPPSDETLSQVAEDPIHESTPKPSIIKDSQPKIEPPPVQKSLKRKNSESSIPSLSDITTVSSHSLNTDSVMGQLSDI